ncbi:chromate transporter [Vogesella sp. EB]|uniref:chromate transporter n=1 Tax=Vogesella TaxID=57739 RepID=UPI00064D03DA|nr:MULTISPECIES: chromate transporter [unclassified Vogesella]KMJ54366.1 chromate transporter [Vogesella sp. EB]MCQ4144168.1 chromate transporter [Vogesella sp. AC12]
MSAMLLALFLVFGQLSLMAVGGANAVVPEMLRMVVNEHGWMTAAEFTALFAIAQSAPGPNVLIASLVGWQMASLPGAAISLIGICGPSSILSFYVAKLWQRFRDYRLCHAIQRGFAPLSIGLVLGGAWLLAGIANTGWSAWLLCAVSALIAWRTSLHPLWLLGAGAVTGLLGWV